IMIDEARIPLIIAGASNEQIDNVNNLSQIVKKLEENKDFEFDENARNIFLTEEGIKHVENMLNIKNLFDEENTEVLSRFNCALHAEHLLHKDIDYIIRKGNVELVDEFTGRIADKRRWPDGLQAAIEVKENINVQSKGKILNSITLQHFLQLYPKICGMTATALEAEKEFKEFYNLDIVIIPPNKKCIRINYPDIIFKTRSFKQKALVKEITEVHNTERPILVGTRSIEESIELSEALTNENIQCNVLNAKNDELEAAIVAEAGKPGAVTISTNMAGRGTDIKLGGENEDEKRKIAALGGLYVIGTNRNESRRIDNQLRGRAGSKYSSLLEQQRKIIFEKRNNILNEDSFIELFKTNSPVQFNRLLNKAGELKLIEICRRLSLLQIDEEWSQYLAEIADLREGIHLLKLGGQEPIFRFREQSIQLFDKMLDELDDNIIQSFNKLKVKDYNIDLNDSGLKAPSSTWTYLINDTPFENTLGIELIGNIGMSIGAGIYGFL
ncbi:MAG: hypothetical protein P8Z35_22535, partial [Ignavibacteriaceae bacterium]